MRTVKVFWILAYLFFSGTSVFAHTSFTWTDTAAPKIWFTIVGSTDATTAVHTAIVTIDTGGLTAPGFALHNPAVSPDYSILDSQLTSNPATSWTATTPAKKMTLLKQSPGVYVLSVTQLPESIPRGTITTDEAWFITVNGLSTPNSISTSITSQNKNLAVPTTDNVHFDVPPQVTISTTPDPPNVSAGDSVIFHANLTDPDRPPSAYTYVWSFNNGNPSTASGPGDISVTYEAATGTYPATVTVTDDLGQSTAIPPPTVQVGVTNSPPSNVTITVPLNTATVFTGAKRTFTASADDEVASELTYQWTITGGSAPTTNQPSINVTFGAPGTGSVALTVTDNASQSTSATAVSVNILPKENLVIPAFAALPANYSPPAIDGIVSEDLGTMVPDVSWSGATQIDYGDGTNRDVAISALNSPDASSNRSLYFAFQVRNDPNLDSQDFVLLAFRGPNSGTTPNQSSDFQEGDVVIIIYPMPAGTISPGSDLIPDLIQFYRYQGGTWALAGTGAAALSGFDAKSHVLPPGALRAWDLEMRVPMNDQSSTDAVTWPDLKNNFLFYCNVGRVDASSGIAVEFTWPRDAPDLDHDVLGPGLLSPSDWSAATTDPGALGRGVYIASPMDIGVLKNGVLSNQIVHPGANRFQATISNSSLETTPGDTSPTGVAATNVKATFRIARWGTNFSNPQWSAIPPDPGSSNPAIVSSIPAPASPSNPGTEDVGFEAGNLDVPSGVTHQCMFVELTSNGNARIVNSKVYRNMTYVDGSRFEDKARLTLPGVLTPPVGRDFERLFIRISTQSFDRDLRPQRASANRKPPLTPVSSLVWIAHTYRDTGSHLIIRGKSFRVVQPAGSFGYIVRHEGDASHWVFELKGANKIGTNFYQYDIPLSRLRANAPEIVGPVIEPVDRKWKIGVFGGTGVPLSPTTTSYTAGLAAQLSASYLLTPVLRLGVLFGYSGLTGKTGISNEAIVNGSAELGYGFTERGTWLFEAHGGAGFYQVVNGSGNFGAHGGVGMERDLIRSLTLGLRFDFHHLFDTTGTQFLTAAIGLAMKF